MEQFRPEQRAVWTLVDESYNAEELLGEKAANAFRVLAARASHHEFPFTMGVLTRLVACTNGAKTDIFPGDPSPLALAIINNNYPQTRKSAEHRAGMTIGNAIDEHVLKAARTRVLESLQAGHAETGHGPPPSEGHPAVRAVKVESSTLSSFTEAAFFQRCASDWDQAVPSELHNLVGRLFFGTSINFDEAYRFLKMIGLVPNSSTVKTDSGGGLGPDAASELNKLLQTGVSTMATKTAGAFGQGDVPTISTGLGGNGHPAILIPMLRGKFGGDAVAASYRLPFGSGRPIQPHAALPESMKLYRGFKKWLWPKLLGCMVEPLGLYPGVDTYETAERLLQKVAAGDSPSDSEEGDRNPAVALTRVHRT